MERRGRSGHGLVLFELIIAIGFFAFFAAVCLRIFFVAYRISEENRVLGGAITAAENAAECFKANTGPVLFYTRDWAPTDQAGAAYCLTLDTQDAQGVKTALITVAENDGEALFALTVKRLEGAVS